MCKSARVPLKNLEFQVLYKEEGEEIKIVYVVDPNSGLPVVTTEEENQQIKTSIKNQD